MRILVINDFIQVNLGGSETYTFNLVKLLKEHGHQVKLWGSTKHKEDFSTFFSRWFSGKYYFQTKKVIKSFKPDLIHINTFSRALSPAPIVAAKKLKVPVIMTVHDFRHLCPRTWFIYQDKKPCKYGFSTKCLYKHCYSAKRSKWWSSWYYNLKFLKTAGYRFCLRRYVDKFICPAIVLKKEFAKSLGVNNISYIPNFSVNQGKSHQPLSNFHHLLFVGRLSKDKGVDVLVKAMPLVLRQHPKAKLEIIGDGPEKDKLIALTKKLDLTDKISFRGKIDHSQLEAYYHETAMTILPSVYMEMFGLVILESFSSSRPVIGSNIGGIPEVIEDKKSGLLFAPNSHSDLAKKITYLLDNPEILEEMSKNAFQRCRDFSPAAHYKMIEREYVSLLKK
ncbi:MAG: glycosyltransferase family 4 protein [Parcubacteria group bacterium]|nr:glycosyltransferase family 4 protein [Parcubacteria group bacterium]